MNTLTIKRAVVLMLVLLACGTTLWAQGDKSQRPSPPATATGKIGDATITINYSSPAVKGRKIWGELVPYDKAWRAGANEATIFQTDKAIKVEGRELPAGKYSLFAVPGEKEWKFIFNTQTGQWGINRNGEANRDPANDLITVTAKPQKSDTMNERLQYVVTKDGFALRWENLDVPVGIK